MQPQLEMVEPARLDGLAESAKDPAQRAGLGGVDRAGCCPEGVRGLAGRRLPGGHSDFKGEGRRGVRCPVDTQAAGPLWEEGLQLRRCRAGAARGPASPHEHGPGDATKGEWHSPPSESCILLK